MVEIVVPSNMEGSQLGKSARERPIPAIGARRGFPHRSLRVRARPFPPRATPAPSRLVLQPLDSPLARSLGRTRQNRLRLGRERTLGKLPAEASTLLAVDKMAAPSFPLSNCGPKRVPERATPRRLGGGRRDVSLKAFIIAREKCAPEGA